MSWAGIVDEDAGDLFFLFERGTARLIVLHSSEHTQHARGLVAVKYAGIKNTESRRKLGRNAGGVLLRMAADPASKFTLSAA